MRSRKELVGSQTLGFGQPALVGVKRVKRLCPRHQSRCDVQNIDSSDAKGRGVLPAQMLRFLVYGRRQRDYGKNSAANVLLKSSVGGGCLGTGNFLSEYAQLEGIRQLDLAEGVEQKNGARPAHLSRCPRGVRVRGIKRNQKASVRVRFQ